MCCQGTGRLTKEAMTKLLTKCLILLSLLHQHSNQKWIRAFLVSRAPVSILFIKLEDSFVSGKNLAPPLTFRHSFIHWACALCRTHHHTGYPVNVTKFLLNWNPVRICSLAQSFPSMMLNKTQSCFLPGFNILSMFSLCLGHPLSLVCMVFSTCFSRLGVMESLELKAEDCLKHLVDYRSLFFFF